MDEKILKALIQLFAIVANVNKDGDIGLSRTIVRSYLKQQLNKKLQNEYLDLFDSFIETHHKGVDSKTKGHKRTSANSVKVLMICQQINNNLQQEQKVLVLIQLLEFINNGLNITDKELEFLETVAETFKIPEHEYKQINQFVLDNPLSLEDKSQYLLITGEHHIKRDYKTIYRDHVEGEIHFLRIESTNMYIFKFIGTTNLYLNGANIPIDRTLVLDKGSSIRSHRLHPVYYSDIVGKYLHHESTTKIVFEAQNVEFRFKNSTNGIQAFNFAGESGELVGIMGGSGVGKSTLLNVLNGNLTPQSGQICINGFDINTHSDQLKGITGFVPQDDLLIEELSVFQNLYYNAKLCFDSMPEEQVVKTVDKVLYDLELIEIKDLTVGNVLNKFISGGQRKRLNIALELIREPAVLFVDEPTSGLSSMDSEMVMDLLKEQTQKGKLIIINIHQPSSDIFKMFDRLLVMDKGGYLIYNGNPVDAVTYFKTHCNFVNADESECQACGNVNPEQVLQIVESKVVDEYGKLTKNRKISPLEWHDVYVEKIESKQKSKSNQFDLPENNFKIPNYFQQLKIFFIRNILAKFTDKQYMLINTLEAPLLALICGFFTKYVAGVPGNPNQYVFHLNDNLPSYLFMCVIAALFLGLTVSAEEIIKDRKILQRERFLNLSWFSYINSKVLLMLLISAFQSVTFILIGNWLLEIKGMNASYFSIIFSTSFLANLIGLNVSASLNSVVTIYILIPLLLVPQMLLSGVIVKFEKLHHSIANQHYVSVIGDIMPSRWAYEALAVNQFENNKYQQYLFITEREMSNAAFIKNFWVPEMVMNLDMCKNRVKKSQKDDILAQKLLLLQNEIKIFAKTQQQPFQYIDSLTIGSFKKGIYKYTKNYLFSVKSAFEDEYNNLYNNRDDILKGLIDKLGNEGMVQLKKQYSNEALNDLVLNNNELTKIVNNGDRLIRMLDPIYKKPEHDCGRAHFYSSRKRVLGKEVDTVLYNVVVLWLMSFILYISLLTNALSGLLTQTDKLRSFIRNSFV